MAEENRIHESQLPEKYLVKYVNDRLNINFSISSKCKTVLVSLGHLSLQPTQICN